MGRRYLGALPAILAVVALLAVPTDVAASASRPEPGQLYSNDGSTFQAGIGPDFQGSATAVCGQGDGFHLTGSRSYEDLGKVYWTGPLSKLVDPGVKYEASDAIGANIWIDTSGDGQFFAWNGDVFSNLNGDDYGALGKVRDLNGSTPVSPLNSSGTWTDVHTLSDLVDKLPKGGNTTVGIWAGLSGAAPQDGTVSSFDGKPPASLTGCSLGAGSTNPQASSAATSWGPNRSDVLMRGSDNALWHSSWNGTAWSAWGRVGGVLTGDPGAVSWGPGRIDVFARGSDNALWHTAWTGSRWSAWESLGGALNQSAAVASWSSGRLDVFGVGLDNALWHRDWDGRTWSGWEYLGGGLTARPAAVSWGPGRIDIFGRGWDSALWHEVWDGSRWSGWVYGGGQLASGPGAASWAANRLDVPVVSPGGGAWHMTWDGAKWSGWQTLGGPWAARNPSAVSPPGTGSVSYFLRGTDGELWMTNGTS